MGERNEYSELAKLEVKYEGVTWHVDKIVYTPGYLDRLKELKRRWDSATSMNEETGRIPAWENITTSELEYQTWKKPKNVAYWEYCTELYERDQKRQYIRKRIPGKYIPRCSAEEVAYHVINSDSTANALIKKFKTYYKIDVQIELNVEFSDLKFGGYRNYKPRPLTYWERVVLALLFIEMTKLQEKYDELYRQNPTLLDSVAPWGKPNIFLRFLNDEPENLSEETSSTLIEI